MIRHHQIIIVTAKIEVDSLNWLRQSGKKKGNVVGDSNISIISTLRPLKSK